MKSDRLNFAPRIGLAWTAAPRLVVRSAYGMFYQHTFRQGRENLLAENPPVPARPDPHAGSGLACLRHARQRSARELLRHRLAHRSGRSRQRPEPEGRERAAVESDPAVRLGQGLDLRSRLRRQQGHPPVAFLERQSAVRGRHLRPLLRRAGRTRVSATWSTWIRAATASTTLCRPGWKSDSPTG